eukprot:1318906-Rhodomonas_salina.2
MSETGMTQPMPIDREIKSKQPQPGTNSAAQALFVFDFADLDSSLEVASSNMRPLLHTLCQYRTSRSKRPAR